MAAQAQEEKKKLFAEEFMEEYGGVKKDPDTKPQPKKRNPTVVQVIGLLAALTAVTLIQRSAYKNSLWNMDDKYSDGYLSYKFMNLLDEEGDEVWSLSSPFFDYELCDFNRDEKNYTTPLGMHAHDSWDTFVDLYGDKTAQYIGISQFEYNEEYDYYAYDDYSSVSGPITIAEFDQEYVRNSNLDLTKSEINVTFEAYYYGDEMYYDYDDYFDAQYDRYDDALAFFKVQPRDGSIRTQFSFGSDKVREGSEGLYEVYVSRNNY